MQDPIIVSLVVTGLGMLMLFLALAGLYGLMLLMTAVLRDRPAGQSAGQSAPQSAGRSEEEPQKESEEAAEAVPPAVAGNGLARRYRAAAIAVALARAQAEAAFRAPPRIEDRSAGLSAWQLLYRGRQVNIPRRR